MSFGMRKRKMIMRIIDSEILKSVPAKEIKECIVRTLKQKKKE